MKKYSIYLLLIVFLLGSCNYTDSINPDDMIGEKIGILLYGGENDPLNHRSAIYNNNYEEIFEIAGIRHKNRVLVFKSLPESGEIVGYYYSVFVKAKNMEQYIGCNSSYILEKVGRPFEIRPKLPERKGNYSYFFVYFQKGSWSELSYYVVILRFNEKNICTDMEIDHWTIP